MFNVHTQMPLGNVSRGFNFPDREKAHAAFARLKDQLQTWQPYEITLILSDDGVDVQQEMFNAQ